MPMSTQADKHKLKKMLQQDKPVEDRGSGSSVWNTYSP